MLSLARRFIHLCVVAAFFVPRSSVGQVVSIPFEPPIAGSESTRPTLSFLWSALNAQATIVMIPGGEGHLGLNSDRRSIGGFYKEILGRLSDPGISEGKINVVIFDSPAPLSYRGEYPEARASLEHIQRIDSVVRHFWSVMGKPIWLFGHSNGAVSITEYHNWVVSRGEDQRIAGFIVSSGRYNAGFKRRVDQPVLYLHHLADGCPRASPASAKENHAKTSQLSTSRLELLWVRGGSSEEGKSPCSSGRHMYSGAGDEVSPLIERFILQPD